jgi:hypothetical protein
MAAPFSIMCFSWNASGLKLCETMSQTKADEARKGFKAFITMKKPCVAPDFFEDIRGVLRERRPSLVVMTTEDEDRTDTYFHAELLPKSMPEIGYSLLKRDKFDGIGESGLVPTKIPTGNPSGNALRISIYARSELMPGFKVEEKMISRFFSNDGQAEVTCLQGDRASGAIGAYVWHENYGKFLFIATRLSSGTDALKVGKTLDYMSYRAATRAANNLCLLAIVDALTTNIPEKAKPDHVILMGDLNYDIVIPGKKNIEIVSQLANNLSAAAIKDLQKYDELKKAMDDPPLDGFKEGVSAEGPLFMPTWKLSRGRPDECVPDKNTNKIDTTCFSSPREALGGLGWHDRILYKEYMTSNYILHCIDYNRMDAKNMHQSTHAGVTAFFELRPIR